MKYVITGGAGFIGSNFVKYLLSDITNSQLRVVVLDKLTYAGKLANLTDCSGDYRFNFVKGDICNMQTVLGIIEKGDIVVNFAAESHVDRSISDPRSFVKTNILGTQVLLEAVKRLEARMLVQVSTDEVYGSVKQGKSLEDDTLLPNSPYSASKAAADLLVRAYVKTYNIDARITRCCNNFGPNQYPEKFIPYSIQCLKNGEKIKLYGNGLNIREWIHVNDHCIGIHQAIHSGAKGEIYNLGSSQLLSNLELSYLILDSFDLPRSQIEFVEDRKGHDFRYCLDFSKATKEIGFKPKINIREYDFRKL